MKHVTAMFLLISAVAVLTGGAESPAEELAYVTTGTGAVLWQPWRSYTGLTLTVMKPDGAVFEKTFPGGTSPFFDLTDAGQRFPDGEYSWELRVAAGKQKRDRASEAEAGLAELPPAPVQSGHFTVAGGMVVDPEQLEAREDPKDILHYDDVIIDGSLCVGFDCVNGESFGFDTIRLKENNLRIKFQDTSNSASFPTNDWQITANDSANGGANKFSIDDTDNGTTPFTIEADAPSHSIYIEDYGRVGFGTSTPVVELHVKDSDTPTLRLEQDGSGGWSPQTWDLAGNESNFFIRDATNGSKLPFRIQPSTPSSTLCLRSSGNVGIGTWSPGYPLEVETTGEDSVLLLERTSGARAYLQAMDDEVQIGSQSDHEVFLMVNDSWKMRLYKNGALQMVSGAICTGGGVWTDASSRDLKENIQDLRVEEAAKALADLKPVKYNYKVDKDDHYVGFIAEDVPDLVAAKDRKGMSPMDVAAVLTKVVQEQQKVIVELQARVEALEKADAPPAVAAESQEDRS